MRFIQFKLVGPAIIVVAILIAGMASIPYLGIAQIDAALRERHETLVKRNIELWISDIEFSLTAWTIWDESIARIDNTFDFEWTDRNIGASLIGTSRTRFVAVIDSADKLVYWRTEDGVKTRHFFERGADAIVADANALVTNVRARELGRNEPGIPKPVTVSRIEVLGDDAVLMTASLFQPDFGTAKSRGERAPVLITAMPIDGSLQDFFGTRFLLDDARISPLADVAADRARAEIAVGAGGEVNVLSWRPLTPARDMLRSAMPLILMVGALLLAAAIFTLSISRAAAKTLVARERQMRHAANHDVLTGLANRSRLEPQFQALNARGPLAVVCLDLDGFKDVNDSHGHAVGDELLKIVATRLEEGVRADDRLFRLGGDEFVILMPDVTSLEAEEACRKLSAALLSPVTLSGAQLCIAASFGIRHVAKGSAACDVALSAADAALYHAKAFGRGRVVRAEDMEASRGQDIGPRRATRLSA